MEEETERVAVRTYVPAYQRDRWREDAEGLEMSQSEFIRTMVQAGRRSLSLPSNPVESYPPAATPGGNGVKLAVLDSLRRRGHQKWEGLFEEVSKDLEDQLDIALDELEEENVINRRHGSYELTGDDGGK